MKNLFKRKFYRDWFLILIIFVMSFVVFSSKVVLADNDNQQNDDLVETYCTQYTLVWKNSQTPVDPSNENDFTSVPAPITTSISVDTDRTPDVSESKFSDDLVSASSTHKGEGVSWKCSDISGTSKGLSSNDEKLGMEECEAAIKIAAKWGAYTVLDKAISDTENFIRDQIIQRVFLELQKGINSAVGNISLSKIFGSGFENITIDNIKKGLDELRSGKLNDAINDLIPNTLKDEAKRKADEIKNKATDELKKIAQQYGGKLVDQAKGMLGLDGGGGGGLPIASEVPVKDEKVVKELKQVQTKQDTAIQEQKKQEVIAKKRAECHLLLQQTVQSIKSSLLYQFTTQTVDWIEGGGIKIANGNVIVTSPQYVKQPGKFFEKVGRDAVDRWLSRVAPQLCQPFRLQVTLDIPSTARITNPYYEPNLSCTLNRVVQNIEDFYQDFRSGGWLAYREILKPQNNYYGASLIAQQLAAQQASAAQQSEKEEIDRNQGFSNTKKCTLWEKYEVATKIDGTPITQQGECSTDPTNPDAPISKWSFTKNKCFVLIGTVSESKIITDKGTTTIDNTTANAKSEIGSGIPSDINISDPDDYKDIDFTADEIFLNGDDDHFYSCIEKSITQPGVVSKKLLEQTTEADINGIINAQDLMNIDEIIQNAIINKITKTGINGLKNLLNKLPRWANFFEKIENATRNPQ